MYESWAQAWWEAAEYQTMLYDEELAEYRACFPMPNLRQYMLDTRGQPR